MNAAIAFVVETLLGGRTIPASATPTVPEEWLPKAKPGPKRERSRRSFELTPREKLIATLSDEYRSAWDLAKCARVSRERAYFILPQLVEAGIAEVFAQPASGPKGEKRSYRRAR